MKNYLDYLERIGFKGEPKVDYATLAELQYRHFLSVPYENIGILEGAPPLSLNIDDIYEKVVTRKRGGYCFELNALLNWLLCEIGFKTTNYFARFLLDEIGIPMRRHRIVRVEIAGEYYLADVGVGTITPEKSLKLVENEETEIRGILYKFTRESFFGWVLWIRKPGEISEKNKWTQLYSFTDDEQAEIDFVQPSFYCQFCPDSRFNKHMIIAIRTETGKYSLSGNILRISDFTAGTSETKECESDEIPAILKKYFGIVL